LANDLIDLEAFTAPAVGKGVTRHTHGILEPGTILRVSPSGRTIWCQVDDPVDGQAALQPGKLPETYRAIRQADGVFRAGHEMWRVVVGVRRARTREASSSAPAGSLTDLAERLERLEPWLLRRRWYPMTYMAIPSILRSTEELLAALAAYSGTQRDAAAALHARLANLLARREARLAHVRPLLTLGK
jgi:hypothetical protein